ncbi:MAG TPA: patatin-like phospholipase family protein [Hyphomicrobiaceae bacterium]|jgi:NTE family protein|nr:patatin-like phospholipase family protein [Hyphomicrobiaceae bacterium]
MSEATRTNALTARKGGPLVLRPSIALALGGGGARGLAHILMLEVFDELGLKPKIIAGTSIGALFGAAYASGLPAALIRAHAEQILSQRLDIARLLFAARAEPIMKFFNVLPVRFALLKPEQLLESVLPSRVARNFAQLQIPLRVVATDFYAQEQVVLSQGALRTAIAASMALPAIFAPVVSEGRTLMDGGLVNPLPFDVIRAEADITVAIDVSGASTGPGKHPQPSAFSALMSSSQILQRSIVREKLKVDQPDIYIDVEVDEFHVLQFHRFRAVLEAAMPAKDKLRRQLLRVLASQTAETLPAAAAPEAEGGRKKRLPRLKRLAQGRRP